MFASPGTPWLRRGRKASARSHQTASYRPSFEMLESRTVPSGAAATHPLMELYSSSNLFTNAPNGVLDVQSYNWGIGQNSGSSLGAFQLTVKQNGADTDLWQAVVKGGHFSSLSLAIFASKTAATPYDTYTFSTASTTRYLSSTGKVQIDLTANQLQEELRAVHADGSLGPSQTSSWDFTISTGNVVAADQVPAPDQQPPLGLSFSDAAGSKEFAATAWSWNGSSISAGQAMGRQFEVTLKPSTLNPALWGDVLSGQSLDHLLLHVRSKTDSTETRTYTFTGAVLTHYTNANGSVAFRFSFATLDEVTHPQHGTGSDVSASWDFTTSTGSVPTPDSVPAPSSHALMGLSFGGSAAGNAFPVLGYTWSASTNASAPSLAPFQVKLNSGLLDPVLWASMLSQATIPQVKLHVHTAGSPTDSVTYTLDNVEIIGYSTTSGKVEIDLRFSKITEKAHAANAAPGSTGTAITAVYDSTTNTATTPALDSVPVLTRNPAMGLTFGADPNGLEFPVQHYTWQGPSDAAGVQLTLQGGALDPALWSTLASGATIPEVELHVRNKAGGKQLLGYKLEGVTISSYRVTSGTAEIHLQFTAITEDAHAQKTAGLLGQGETASWHGANQLSYPKLDSVPGSASLPAQGLSFGSGTAAKEFAVKSFAWNVRNSNPKAPGTHELTVTLKAGALDPALWGALASQDNIPQLQLHVRNQAGGSDRDTYTIQNAQIGDYSTTDGLVTIHLRFAADATIRETYHAKGHGAANTTASWTLGSEPVAPAPAGIAARADNPNLGLSFGTELRGKDFAVNEYQWLTTAAPSGSSQPATVDFEVQLQSNAANPALWAAEVLGKSIANVIVHVRTKAQGKEYLTYTLTTATVTEYQRNADGSVTLSLAAERIEEDYRPQNPDGSLGNPISGGWDRVMQS